MNKLFSTSLFALGVMCATSAAAYSVQGGHMYIQDTSAPVIFTYGEGPLHYSHAYDTNIVWVATIDANGNLVDGWKQLFQSGGIAPDDIAVLVPGTSDLPGVPGDRYSFRYDVNPNAVELIFKWQDISQGGKWYFSGGKDDMVTYYDASKTVRLGLEDNYGRASPPGYDYDYNDVIIWMTNVGSKIPPPPPPVPPPPTIPEPETYAMMLAGLGMIGVMARRRRKSL